MEILAPTNALVGKGAIVPIVKIRYCLYARKSTESDEKQALSIESQVKEMLQIAERDGLEVIDIRRESHSANPQTAVMPSCRAAAVPPSFPSRARSSSS